MSIYTDFILHLFSTGIVQLYRNTTSITTNIDDQSIIFNHLHWCQIVSLLLLPTMHMMLTWSSVVDDGNNRLLRKIYDDDKFGKLSTMLLDDKQVSIYCSFLANNCCTPDNHRHNHWWFVLTFQHDDLDVDKRFDDDNGTITPSIVHMPNKC